MTGFRCKKSLISSAQLTYICFVLSCNAGFFECQGLAGFNVKKNSGIYEISVSGLGCGAAFAHNYHFAFSEQVKRIGMFGSYGPFGCAVGKTGLEEAIESCSGAFVEDDAEKFLEDAKNIDDIKNLEDAKVFLFHGKEDFDVPFEAFNQIEVFLDQKVKVDLQSVEAENDGNPVGHGIVRTLRSRTTCTRRCC